VNLPSSELGRQSEDKRLFHGATVIRFVNDFADEMPVWLELASTKLGFSDSGVS